MPAQQFYGAVAPLRSTFFTDSGTTRYSGTSTTSSTPFTNVTPTQLVASLPFDTTGVAIILDTAQTTSATRQSFLIDIMVGASGSETVVIGPLPVGGHPIKANFLLPIYIPAGTRISFRARGNVASRGVGVQFAPMGPANRDTVGLPQRWVAYGILDDASNAQGTALPVPSLVASYGTWATLTASTTYHHDLWLPMIDRGADTALPSSGYGYTHFTFDSTINGEYEDGVVTSMRSCMFDCRSSTTLSAAWPGGQAFTYPFAFGASPYSPIFHAPKPAGTAVSARMLTNVTTLTSYAIGASILASI